MERPNPVSPEVPWHGGGSESPCHERGDAIASPEPSFCPGHGTCVRCVLSWTVCLSIWVTFSVRVALEILRQVMEKHFMSIRPRNRANETLLLPCFRPIHSFRRASLEFKRGLSNCRAMPATMPTVSARTTVGPWPGWWREVWNTRCRARHRAGWAERACDIPVPPSCH